MTQKTPSAASDTAEVAERPDLSERELEAAVRALRALRALRETTPGPVSAAPFPGEEEWAARALQRAAIHDFRPPAREGDDRAWVALMLAPTPDVWQALLEGEVVLQSSLDRRWLARFREGGLIRA